MTQWYVKELSKITQVSVQTLHHYDRIGLLEPSVRLANGYRLYSEKDLLKLQQIIALKFFGFELTQIKTLLTKESDMMDHFSVQAHFLEEKAKSLFEASCTLKNVIAQHSEDKSIPWENIIQLIEVYRMTQQLEKTWAGKVLTPAELKEYAGFLQGLQTRFTKDEKEAFEKEWRAMVADIHANLNNDPTSELGMAIGQRCLDRVNKLYGKEHAALRKAIWEKGFKGGHNGAEHGLTPESVAWLDQAIIAYNTRRITDILAKVATHPQAEVVGLWQALLTDLYGDAALPKKELTETILLDAQTSQAIKQWLKKQSV